MNDTNATQLAIELESTKRELARLKSGVTNSGFLQVSRKHIDDLNELAAQMPASHKTLWTLCKAMNKQNAVMVSVESLGKLTGYSRRTLARALSLLREQQWIEVLKIGSANVYRVNSSVFWQDRADGRWSSFSAQVLVNFDEQDEKTKTLPNSKTRHIPFVEAGEDVLVPDADKEDAPPPDQPQFDFHARST